MSEENVEVAARAIGAFNESDISAFAALTAPDFEWSPSMVAIDGETFLGREGIEAYFGKLNDAWEKFHIHRDRFRDSADVVVMLGRLEGRGRSSGVPVDSSLGMLFYFRDGLISRIRGFLDHCLANSRRTQPDVARNRSGEKVWILQHDTEPLPECCQIVSRTSMPPIRIDPFWTS